MGLDQDINEFFNQIDDQPSFERKKTLKNLIAKHMHLNSAPCSLTGYDFETIKSKASTMFSTETFPTHFKDGDKKRKIQSREFPNLFVILATIEILAGKNCLKRFPSFEYDNDYKK